MSTFPNFRSLKNKIDGSSPAQIVAAYYALEPRMKKMQEQQCFACGGVGHYLTRCPTMIKIRLEVRFLGPAAVHLRGVMDSEFAAA